MFARFRQYTCDKPCTLKVGPREHTIAGVVYQAHPIQEFKLIKAHLMLTSANNIHQSINNNPGVGNIDIIDSM